MPTGYTAPVQDGMPFQQFVMRCARGMGALVMMRDDPMDAPIPKRFEPSDYHSKALAKAQEQLAWLEQMPLTEADREAQAEHEKELAQHRANVERAKTIRGRYSDMLEQVSRWTPPTEEHVGFKQFMIDQLRESLKFDCYEADDQSAPARLPADEWRRNKVNHELRNIEYHATKHREEVERTEGRNEWLRALRESLAQHKPDAA